MIAASILHFCKGAVLVKVAADRVLRSERASVMPCPTMIDRIGQLADRRLSTLWANGRHRNLDLI